MGKKFKNVAKKPVVAAKKKKKYKSRLNIPTDAIGSSSNQKPVSTSASKRPAYDSASSSDSDSDPDTKRKPKRQKSAPSKQYTPEPPAIPAQRKKKGTSGFDKLLASLSKTSAASKKASTKHTSSSTTSTSQAVSSHETDISDAPGQDQSAATSSQAHPQLDVTTDVISEDDTTKTRFWKHFSQQLTSSIVDAWQPEHVTHKSEHPLLGVISSSRNFEMGQCSVTSHIHEAVQSLTKDDIVPDALDSEGLAPIAKSFLNVLDTRQDILFNHRTHFNANSLRKAYITHALNHVMHKHNRVSGRVAHTDSVPSNSMGDADAKVDEETQMIGYGFSRPSVLILCSSRQSALDVMRIAMQLIPVPENQDASIRKMYVEFGFEEYEPNPSKPLDYNLQFRGDSSDNFRMGMAVFRNSLKLYSEFYNSDIILASPLGLQLIIGDRNESNSDFLSSIELVVVDDAHALMMQNFDLVWSVFGVLNAIPKSPRDTDFSKILPYFLEGWSKFYRQSVILASHHNPEIHSLFNKFGSSLSGKMIVTPPSFPGVLLTASLFRNRPLKQVFQRFSCSSLEKLPDTRFEYFTENLYPTFVKSKSHVLIFVPSYFDFVRLRNWMKHKDLMFGSLSEYNKAGASTKIRNQFAEGDLDIVLYTERFHFFRRLKIKGVHHVIFYSPPEFSHFYAETVAMIQDHVDVVSSTLVFSVFDMPEMERIVGTSRFRKLMTAPTDTSVFC